MSTYQSLVKGTEKDMVSGPSHFNSFSGISQAGFGATGGFGAAPPLLGRASASAGLGGGSSSAAAFGGSSSTTATAPQLFNPRANNPRGRSLTPVAAVPGILSSGSNLSSIPPVSSGQQPTSSAHHLQSLFPPSMSGYLLPPASALHVHTTSMSGGQQQIGSLQHGGSGSSFSTGGVSGGAFASDARQHSPNNSSSGVNSHIGFSSTSAINLPSGNIGSRFSSAGSGIPVQSSSAMSNLFNNPSSFPSVPSGCNATSQDITGYGRSINAETLKSMLSSVGKGGDGFANVINNSSSASVFGGGSFGLSESDFPSLTTPLLSGAAAGAAAGSSSIGVGGIGAAALGGSNTAGSGATGLNAVAGGGVSVMDFRSSSNPGGLVSQSAAQSSILQQQSLPSGTSLIAPSLLPSLHQSVSSSNNSIQQQQHHHQQQHQQQQLSGMNGGSIGSRATIGNTSSGNPLLLSSSGSNLHNSVTPNHPLSAGAAAPGQPQGHSFTVASLPSVNCPGLGVNSQAAIPLSIASGSNFAIGRNVMQHSATGSSSTNFAGLMKGGSSESNSAEFQINSEDFPALQGSESTDVRENSLTLSHGVTSDVCKDVERYPGDKSILLKQQRGIQTSPDGTVTNIPPGMILDQFGIVGMLTLLRALDTDTSIVGLAVGHDLTTLGLNLNAPDRGLYRNFGGPWIDIPCRPQDIDMTVPPEYLTNHLIQERLAPLRLNRYGDDLLFFLFYMYGGEMFQLAAAAELYNRDWRYSKEERVWVTRAPGMPPVDKTSTYERGTYYVFDPTQWRKVTKEMLLEYDKLEDRPAPIVPFQQQRMAGGTTGMMQQGISGTGGAGSVTATATAGGGMSMLGNSVATGGVVNPTNLSSLAAGNSASIPANQTGNVAPSSTLLS